MLDQLFSAYFIMFCFERILIVLRCDFCILGIFFQSEMNFAYKISNMLQRAADKIR